jgi:hypothetical protein
MITIGGWLTPTREVGLLAYTVAVTCCGFAWVRDRNDGHRRRLAALLTLFELTLLLDIVFNWRWTLHQFLIDAALRANLYQNRRLPQLLVLLLLAVVVSLIFLQVRSRFRCGRGSSLALFGAMLSLILWCTELISLHQVDHVLYHQIANVMAVSLLWVLACLMTSIGILMSSPREGKQSVQP